MSYSPKGSVLLLGLWVMSVFTMWTVGQAGTLDMVARLVHRHQDILDAVALADDGFTHALRALDADPTRAWDASSERWGQRQEGTAPTGTWTTRVTDEGGTLNVNTVGPDVLARLPESSSALADALVGFRTLRPFRHVAELALLPGMTAERLAQWAPLITVVGQGSANLNSAPAGVLEALGVPATPAAVFVTWRNGPDGELGTSDDHVFHDVADIAPAVSPLLTPEDAAILMHLVQTGRLGVRSSAFRIVAHGRSAGRSHTSRTLTALVERQAPGAAATIRGWHED